MIASSALLRAARKQPSCHGVGALKATGELGRPVSKRAASKELPCYFPETCNCGIKSVFVGSSSKSQGRDQYRSAKKICVSASAANMLEVIICSQRQPCSVPPSPPAALQRERCAGCQHGEGQAVVELVPAGVDGFRRMRVEGQDADGQHQRGEQPAPQAQRAGRGGLEVAGVGGVLALGALGGRFAALGGFGHGALKVGPGLGFGFGLLGNIVVGIVGAFIAGIWS